MFKAKTIETSVRVDVRRDGKWYAEPIGLNPGKELAAANNRAMEMLRRAVGTKSAAPPGSYSVVIVKRFGQYRLFMQRHRQDPPS